MSSAREMALLDNSGGMLLLVDPASLAIAEVSKPTLELLGYRREELLGRPITDIECSLADSFFWEGVRKGEPAGARKAAGSYRCASGNILEASKTVSRTGGNGKSWLVVRAEPLDQSPFEDPLSSVTSLLQATLEATADGVLLVNRAGAIVNMNRRFSQMWGLPEEILLQHEDRAVFDFMAGLVADSQPYLARLAEIGQCIDGETFDLVTLADGRFIERKSMPARQGAQIFGRVFSFTDISERMQAEAMHASLEAQLRESQKMQAIGTLAGGIAHDFNNIIATIMGNAELAREDAQANPVAVQSLDEIRKAGSRGRDLVQQILSFSRRQPTERKLISIAPVVEEAVRLLRATLPSCLVLEVNVDANVSSVRADSTQIQQVVLNLVTNAMQAINGRSGRIGIRLDTVVLDAAMAEAHPALRALHGNHPGSMVRLTVSDDGPGMDAATLGRIFQPFFTTKAVNEGTGLGLSVVHGIVQTHEGAIEVESQPGWGSTFIVYLPASEETTAVETTGERTRPAAAAPAPNGDGIPHILYLDDDASLVLLVRRLLERRGFRVSGFTAQREALDAIRNNTENFALFVTDYNMPGMSGLDVARAVRAIRPDLPVAIASGFVDEALQLQADNAGVRGLIFKASAAEDLCEAFSRLVRTVGHK